jgi:predicted regulator of Ras-like GTPase activity (Roadblock/LC7/MglB family)
LKLGRPAVDAVGPSFTLTKDKEMREAQKTADELRASALRSVLRELNASSADIEASACISSDGYTLAAVLGQGVDPDRFGAMCASLLALAQRASQEIQRGNLKLVLVEGEQGVMLLVQAGPDAILAVGAKPSKNLGMIFLDARKTAQKLADVIASRK